MKVDFVLHDRNQSDLHRGIRDPLTKEADEGKEDCALCLANRKALEFILGCPDVKGGQKYINQIIAQRHDPATQRHIIKRVADEWICQIVERDGKELKGSYRKLFSLAVNAVRCYFTNRMFNLSQEEKPAKKKKVPLARKAAH